MKSTLAHRVSVSVIALMLAPFPVFAEQADPATEDAANPAMATYATIAWRDSLNLGYANLGNDQFLLDTEQGLLLWDVPGNSFSRPEFAPEIGEVKVEKMDDRFEVVEGARLGSHPADTLVRVSTGETSSRMANLIFGLAAAAGVSTGGLSSTLLWWDGKNRRFAAALSMRSRFAPHLLSLGPHHALVCSSFSGGSVLRLRQTGDKTSLMWEESDDPEARAALRSTGVVGAHGYKDITEADIAGPVFYDASLCGWEIKAPPENAIKPFLDRKTRAYAPIIKPYFLRDGRTLLSEVNYFDGYWKQMNPPLLWQPGANRWVTIQSTHGGGGELHRAGQEEPVMSHAAGSNVVEFLDTKTMRWVRSQQRLPDYVEKIEPLSNGQAVVFLRDGRDGVKVPVGLIEPMRESDSLPEQESAPPLQQPGATEPDKSFERRAESFDPGHCPDVETDAAKCAGE